jgi:hypothetical protein
MRCGWHASAFENRICQHERQECALFMCDVEHVQDGFWILRHAVNVTQLAITCAPTIQRFGADNNCVMSAVPGPCDLMLTAHLPARPNQRVL